MIVTGAITAWLNVFIEGQFLGNRLWQWLACLGVILAAVVVGKIVALVVQRQAQSLARREWMQVPAMLLRSLSGPGAVMILAGGLYLTTFVLNLTISYQERRDGTTVDVTRDLGGLWLNICKTLAVLAVGWFIYHLVDVVELYLRRWTSRTESALDDQLVPLVRKTLRVFVVVVVLLFVAQNIFNWNIAALLAGLGVGGLAVALAARETLANVFGSVTIFTDRPFRLGDRIVVKGYDGFVEEVGFRSTRIRTLEGHLVVIPNAVITAEAVENIGQRPSIRRLLNVTITYDTPPDKVQKATDILREMLAARSASFRPDEPPRVYFSDFNAASLNIAVYYWFTPPDWWLFLAFNHAFNLELLRRYNEAGIEFAFPTQTLYLKGATSSLPASPS